MNMLRVFFACVLVAVCSGHGFGGFPGFKRLKNIGSLFGNKQLGFLRKIKQEVLGVHPEGGDEKYKFCNGLECPTYDLVSKGKGFEHRCYNETHWVATTASMPHPESSEGNDDACAFNMKTMMRRFKGGGKNKHRCPRGFGKMFHKLYDYIRGANDKRQKIAMTAPVLTEMQLSEDGKIYAQMNFFVPPVQVATLPQPTADDVKIVTLPARCVYVRSYGGWQMSINRKMMLEKKKLMKSLVNAGKKFVESPLLFAGYDSPWKLRKRHNEVALIAADSNDDEGMTNDIPVVNGHIAA